MVKRLEAVFLKAEHLSDRDQEALAGIIETEMIDDARWQARFEETSQTLTKIVERAKSHFRSGSCSEL
jgi:hypothetical protein